MNYVCATCGTSHEGVPLSFAADFPDVYANMSVDDRQNRIILGSDQCVIDSEIFCIRGCIEIPVIGNKGPFLWGLWARIKEEDFDEIAESWTQSGRENLHGPFKGRLANRLNVYPDTLNLTLTLHVQQVGQRPLFLIDELDHPLAVAQREGMTIKQTQELVSRLLHEPS
jgi:hypothetical protein